MAREAVDLRIGLRVTPRQLAHGRELGKILLGQIDFLRQAVDRDLQSLLRTQLVLFQHGLPGESVFQSRTEVAGSKAVEFLAHGYRIVDHGDENQTTIKAIVTRPRRMSNLLHGDQSARRQWRLPRLCGAPPVAKEARRKAALGSSAGDGSEDAPGLSGGP